MLCGPISFRTNFLISHISARDSVQNFPMAFMLISKPSGGDLAGKDVPDGPWWTLCASVALPSHPRGGAGGLVPQALETGGSALTSDSILSPEHWRGMAEEPLAKVQGGP